MDVVTVRRARLVLGWVTLCRSGYATSHPGELSLAIPLWVGAMSTGESWDVNRHTARCTSAVSVVWWCECEPWFLFNATQATQWTQRTQRKNRNRFRPWVLAFASNSTQGHSVACVAPYRAPGSSWGLRAKEIEISATLWIWSFVAAGEGLRLFSIH